jgi:hypothetical protein
MQCHLYLEGRRGLAGEGEDESERLRRRLEVHYRMRGMARNDLDRVSLGNRDDGLYLIGKGCVGGRGRRYQVLYRKRELLQPIVLFHLGIGIACLAGRLGLYGCGNSLP